MDTDFVALARRSLSLAGYHVVEMPHPSGMMIEGSRSGNERPWFRSFGVDAEQAYRRALVQTELTLLEVM